MRPAVLSALLALGCGGPSIADLATPTVTLTVRAVATQPGVAAVGEPQGGLGIERAFVSMSSLTLSPCRSGAAKVVLSARGYELISDPPFDETVTTAANELCSLRFDIDPLSQNNVEGVPEDSSLYASGQNAVTSGPFEMASVESFSLMFEAAEGASFGSEPLLLGFDLSVWLATLPPEPELIELAQDRFESQLRSAVALYVDRNDNRTLDQDELTPVATAAPAR
jgi:hypothetical protein